MPWTMRSIGANALPSFISTLPDLVLHPLSHSEASVELNQMCETDSTGSRNGCCGWEEHHFSESCTHTGILQASSLALTHLKWQEPS